MDRNEAAQKFVRSNLKLILSPDPFPENMYKDAKRDYFVVQLKSSVGMPRDPEIASQCIMYLFKTKQITSDEKLKFILELPFFKSHVHDSTLFEEYLHVNTGKPSVPIDLGQVSRQEYVSSIEEKMEQKVIEKRSEQIEQAMQEKWREYESLPSVLDDNEFAEPQPEEKPESATEYVAWWKHLGLTADPFPSEEGLAGIAKDLYDKVVHKTGILNRYLSYEQEARSELFKSTVFFGEFGSGKTTFFEFLRMILIKSGIHGIYIQLYGEPDTHSFRIRFQRKLLDALCDLYESLRATNPRSWVSSQQADDAIASLMKEIGGSFVVFIDDLHKDRDNFPIAMNFISTLQTFKSELMRAQPDLTLAFYIAGSLDWERAIRADIARYSGSFSRQEVMPPLTPEAAKEMLDLRFQAFSLNPENSRAVELDRIRQIYRYMQNNHLPITYRQFINTVVSEFRDGKFDVLTANPIQIPTETLNAIRSLIESVPRLKSSFNLLLFGGGIQKTENRQRSIQVLIKIYLEKGIGEESPHFKERENRFFFQRLARSGLVQKSKLSESRFKWVVCRELVEKNKEILNKYNLSLEDYLPQIYGGSTVTIGRGKTENEEIRQIRFFLDSPIAIKEVRGFVEESVRLHAAILQDEGTPLDRTEDVEGHIDRCRKSLAVLTRGALAAQGIDLGPRSDEDVLAWWKDSWHPLEEISEFINVGKAQERKPQERLFYACSIYRQAYSEIFNFLKDQCDKTRYLRIVQANLTNYEIKQLNEIRGLLASGDYYDAAELTTKMNERKLRLFLFNIFRLLYGEQTQSRLNRLDRNTREYVLRNIAKDTERDFSIATNEFEQVNRSDYKSFILPAGEGIGSQNWSEVFCRVFYPMSELEVRDFFERFCDINIQVGHMKEGSITAEQQTRIFDYVRRSQEIVQRLNRTYRNILEKCLYHGRDGSELYISFFNFKDRLGLKPILLDAQTVVRLSEQFSSKPEFTVDLEDWHQIEQYYAVSYPVFVAFLSRSIRQTQDDLLKTKLKVEIKGVRGCVISLRIQTLTPIETENGTKLLNNEELKRYLEGRD